MNVKPAPGPRTTPAPPPRPVRPHYLQSTTPTDARTALQQSLDRRW